MKLEKNKEPFKIHIKYANFNVFYFLYYQFKASYILIILLNIIPFFQILALMLDDKFINLWNDSKHFKKITDFFKTFRIIYFFENNWIGFTIVTIFTFIFSIFSFLCYTKLFFDSFFNIKISNQIVLLKFVGINFCFLYHLLYFPFMEINLNIIMCPNDSIVTHNKYSCYKGKYNIFLILSIICSIIEFYISLLYVNFYYNKGDTCSYSISKYVIMNSQRIFLFIKTIFLISFYINKKYNLKNLIFLVFLIGSYINLYCFYIEKLYSIKIKLNLILNFYLSIIIIIVSFLLFMANLLKHKNFKGFFYIGILMFILFVLFIYTKPKSNLKIQKFYSFKSELEIYTHINFLLINLNNYNKSRNELLFLICYTSINSELKNLNINTDIKNNIINNEEIQFYMKKYIEKLFKIYINIFKNTYKLRLLYIMYQIEYLKKNKKAYLLLCELEQNYRNKLSYCQEFFIYRIKKQIEEEIFEDYDNLENISINYQINTIIDMILKVTKNYEQFWTLLLEKAHNEDTLKLNEIGNEIGDLNKEINYKIGFILSKNIKNKKIYILYGNYINEILNKNELSKKFINDTIFKDIEYNYKENEIDFNDILNIDEIKSSNELQFIIASGKNDNFGKILKISSNFAGILGYNDVQLLGNNFDILLPDFLREEHDKLLKNKIRNMEYININNDYITNKNKISNNIDNNNNQKKKQYPKKIEIFFKTSSKYILPLSVFTGIFPDENFSPIIFCKLDLNKIQENYMKLTDHSIILTDINFIIQTFTANSKRILGSINYSYINGNVDIIEKIPEIFREYKSKTYGKIDNEKFLLVKKNIINKNYVDDVKFEKVSWNDRPVKLRVNELFVGKKILGYIFYFQKINKYESSKKLKKKLSDIKNNSNSSSPKLEKLSFPNKNKIKLNYNNFSEKNLNLNLNLTWVSLRKYSELSQNNSIENFEDIINDDFLPEGKKIDFNMDEQTFLFKNFNKKEEYYEIENIGNIIKNEILKNSAEKEIKETKTSNSALTSSEEFSSSNSSDSISKSSISSKETKKIDMPLDQKYSMIEKVITKEKIEDNYYKVNLSKVHFSLYDYETNSIIDIKLYHKTSKVEEIKNIEKAITKKKKEGSRKNKIHNSNSVFFSHNLNSLQLEKQKNNNANINYETSYLIYSRTKPKLLNKSIIYLFLSLVIFFLILLFLTIYYFYYSFVNRQNLYTIFKITFYISDLMQHVQEIFYYSLEMILLQNPKYTNYYMTREELLNYCIKGMLEIFEENSNLLDILKYNQVKISKKNKDIIDNFEVTGIFISNNFTKEINSTYKLLYILEEYTFSIYSLAKSNSSDKNFFNEDYCFIIYNSDTFVKSGLQTYFLSFINEYNNKLKNNKFLVWIVFILLIIFNYEFIFLNNYQNNKVSIEKEKNLKIFFKIDEIYIRTMILKCKKFIELNSVSYDSLKNFVEEPLINMNEEESSTNYVINENTKLLDKSEKKVENINDFNSFSENDSNKNSNFENLNENTNKSKLKINIKKSKKFIIISFIHSSILLLIILFLNLMLMNYFNKIYHYINIYYLTLSFKIEYVVFYNYLRLYVAYGQYSTLITSIKNKINYLNNNICDSYKILDQQLNYLYDNITKYGLPSNSYKHYQDFLQESACIYIENFLATYNKTCSSIGDNIINYGIKNMMIYYLNTIQNLLENINNTLNYITKNFYSYFELYYGNYVYDIYTQSNTVEDEEDYNKNNPFNYLNSEEMKTIYILNENVLKEAISNVTNILAEDINNLFNHIKIFIIILLIIFYFMFFLFFLFFYLPDILKKNKEITKTRNMLNIIPKDLLYNILLNEKTKKK